MIPLTMNRKCVGVGMCGCVCVCGYVCVWVCVGVDVIPFTFSSSHTFPLPLHTLLPHPLLRMVECIHCGREMHKICILHHENIWSDGFQCENCLKAKRIVLKENKFSAKRKLPCMVTS